MPSLFVGSVSASATFTFTADGGGGNDGDGNGNGSGDGNHNGNGNGSGFTFGDPDVEYYGDEFTVNLGWTAESSNYTGIVRYTVCDANGNPIYSDELDIFPDSLGSDSYYYDGYAEDFLGDLANGGGYIDFNFDLYDLNTGDENIADVWVDYAMIRPSQMPIRSRARP